MPNFNQLALLLSSVGSFLVLFATARYLFPDTFPVLDFGLLFNKPSSPPPKTFMSSMFTINHWSDLLAGDKIAGMLFTGLAAWMVVSWFTTKKRTPTLDKQTYNEYPLIEKVEISPNTALYRFGLPHPDDILGIPIGQHITVAADINGKTIARSYTPTSSDEDRGHFDLVIKTYPQGNISQVMANLKIGQHIKIKGPKGQFKYTMGMTRAFGMIAGGTGITPMYQIITHILYNSQDPTHISLIYANNNKEDILLKLELDELSKRHADRFSVHYVLVAPPKDEKWEGGVGYVTKDTIKEKFPAPGPIEDNRILLCGPPPMVSAMKKNLTELNYAPAQTISKVDDSVFVF
jgi:cytochrome-b5 reductase